MLAAAVFLLAGGILQLRTTSVDALPEFGTTRVEVQTESLGLSAEEVEQLITNPLEQEFFNGLPWLDRLRSSSIPGLSSIEMEFEPGTDVMLARQVVQERLTMVPALPAASSKPPFVIQPVSSTSRLLLVGLSSKDLSPLEIGVLARWTIQPRLLSVPGVANVAIWGHRDRQLQVQVDPSRLKQHGVTLDQVISTTGNALWVSPLTFVEASTPGTGGFLDSANQRIDIQHTQPIKTAQDLAKVAVEGAAKTGLRLGDVASVVEDHQPLIGDSVVDDQPNTILVVERFPGTSVGDVTRAVDEALRDMAPGLAGLQTDTTIFRPADFVEAALANLMTALLIGALLLLLVLAAFLFDWRSALISIVALGLSLTVALGVLSMLGGPLNLIALSGMMIALAVVVHDAVTDVDDIRRRLAERREGVSRATTVIAAVAEVRGTILVATVVIAATVVPVVLIGGTSGALLKPVGLGYALAILASMLVALTVVPALAAALLPDSSVGRESPLARWLRRGYAALLRRIVSRPTVSYVAAALILVAGFAPLPLLGGQQLAPPLKDRNLLIRWEGIPGASLPEMNRITAAASAELRSVPGVRNVGALMGRAITSDQVSGVGSGELWVTLDPAADYDATVAGVRDVVNGYPGLVRDVLTYPDQRLDEVGAGTAEPVVVRVYGNDFDVLEAKADEVVQAISTIDGIAAPRVQTPDKEPTVEIEVSIDKAAAHGIKPGEVRRTAATLMSGITAGNLFEEQKVFDVVVLATPEGRQNLDSLRNVLIDTPSGNQVRVGDVAEVRIRPNQTNIRHDAVSRYIDVVAEVRGRSLGAVTSDVESRVQQITFPKEHHLEVLGDAAQRQSSHLRTWLHIIAAAMAIFFLLQAGLRSWRLALLLFLLLPVALSGGVLAAALRKDTISVLSLLALLGVFAFAVRAGLLLVRHVQHLEEEGQALGPAVVLRAAEERFGATVMTAVGVALALVPVVAAGSVTGLEVIQPMAVIIMGGLLSTTLLVLFVLPSLYLRFASGRSSSGDPADDRAVSMEETS
ncbi:efflux RND transporter permease subunit [Kribbella caucasensis]|uniref:efflux RND transporter permease subunit n=1 Tax=Kribbella caucasensis TaxID=2512215 RepID=UPI00192DCC88|nr:efflux RND transporter permease subunit [Kribbella sp. VKM Ac-2527]